ncbi:uncharacterized protein BDR25DRAFT_350393 [Lindgomyces ingoldianus]|uniref:Uncharacterized protein n=1 Tax=Lindgomyces ingoldianus TaxID=673940 RepID=A0ACB6RBH0_9PLEO|nr:uncharacterized protein BDR25DRAFT_350393 [Lindgomyces ingoldianus]KAF2476093.1 hypothetical protein BDR25DRAFT_350393 [Lindgomyces ingoldianus]
MSVDLGSIERTYAQGAYQEVSRQHNVLILVTAAILSTLGWLVLYWPPAKPAQISQLDQYTCD